MASKGETMTNFDYIKTHEMKPREGNRFATTYYKQTLEQRKKMNQWLLNSCQELEQYFNQSPEHKEAWQKPMRGFPKTGKQKNRSLKEVVDDMKGECYGTKKDGMPKDFAQAPIERWNKALAGTKYEFEMTQRSPFDPKPNTFNEIFSFSTH